ncbi:TIR domain-containing protein [Pseudobutyrivibrio ruminis]|uniref:Thoeris protein ThsB TIR-like domain-containing protein n=1 Tax=Pseudobutyrivibrio ruminis TaxID=46206 RepID=A0A2G3DTV4_9FIRM|nr:TIR domain-containing protein [Pseudobutyrivibrio ruminis]PHU34414.1 hypothetical protein CSX01_10160 [Pseudobutyrivibrio ruminis]
MKKNAFISFDYDHDLNLKNLLVGQSRNEDSPFEIRDMSIKEAVASNWKEYARKRIKTCDVVIVICGSHTNTAVGVSTEIQIAKEERIPYFLLDGGTGNTKKPTAAAYDKVYEWTWMNLKMLINGYR